MMTTKKREQNVKLFRDLLLDSENESNEKEDSNHNNSDYNNYTHYGNDSDGNSNSDYNEGPTIKYTAEEFLRGNTLKDKPRICLEMMLAFLRR